MLNEIGMAQIKRHEGKKLRAYDDADGVEIKPGKVVSGWVTIGYGRNLIGRGITDAEADYLFENDMNDFIDKVNERWPWIQKLDMPRKWALYNMSFNMGIEGLAQFTQTLDAIKNKQWERAAVEMLDSKWAKQVGQRAKDLSAQIRSGDWQ